jgi:hypothetical protein
MASSERIAAALATEPALGEHLRRAFFRSFFRLLILFIGVAEWACVAWVLLRLGVRVPLVVHLAAPLAILLFNRWIVLGRGRRGLRAHPLAIRLLRGYAAIAFTCTFCSLVLALGGIAWCLERLVPTPAGLWLGGILPPGRLVDAGMATVAGLMLFGYTLGQRRLVVSRITVPIPGLPPALDGLRVVQLSDLHMGQYLGRRELADHVRRVNALEPDLICLTGDLVDRAETCRDAFPTLAGLTARHGVLVTLGNHDFYAGADRVAAALRRLTPFTVLRDERADLVVKGARLTVVGVDDLGRDWARGVLEHPALPGLADGLPDGRPWILLSHRPDCFAQAARLGVSLMLSGHTHGGQLALPAWPGRKPRNLAQFISRFDRGLFHDGGSTLYVNRGLGFTGQRIRLFTPREVACIELRATPSRQNGRQHGTS